MVRKHDYRDTESCTYSVDCYSSLLYSFLEGVSIHTFANKKMADIKDPLKSSENSSGQSTVCVTSNNCFLKRHVGYFLKRSFGQILNMKSLRISVLDPVLEIPLGRALIKFKLLGGQLITFNLARFFGQISA